MWVKTRQKSAKIEKFLRSWIYNHKFNAICKKFCDIMSVIWKINDQNNQCTQRKQFAETWVIHDFCCGEALSAARTLQWEWDFSSSLIFSGFSEKFSKCLRLTEGEKKYTRNEKIFIPKFVSRNSEQLSFLGGSLNDN